MPDDNDDGRRTTTTTPMTTDDNRRRPTTTTDDDQRRPSTTRLGGKFLEGDAACPAYTVLPVPGPCRGPLVPPFNIIKGVGGCAECTPSTVGFPLKHGRFLHKKPHPCSRVQHPNVSDCTRMYPNVPECTRMYPGSSSECTYTYGRMYPNVPFLQL